jgi:hypothetical protein
VIRSAPLILAEGRLEQREGAINVVVNEMGPLDADKRPRSEVDKESAPEPAPAIRLRQVAPSGHNFG